MYTGKLQVIKALTSSFERQNESHHIIITAPTGTTVALVEDPHIIQFWVLMTKVDLVYLWQK